MLLTLPIRDVLPATPRARIVQLALEGASFPYAAGQAVLVASHDYEKRRPYSIASAPEDTARDDHIELLVGVDESGHPGAHLILERGAAVDVEGPLGRFVFPDHPAERRFLFIAGGTGIAPLRAMLRHALRLKDARIGLLYSARTSAEFAFEHELRTLAEQGRIELKQTVTRDAAADWEGLRGRVGHELLTPLVHDRGTLCFVCGPVAFVEDTLVALERLHVPRAQIRIEEWG